MKSMFCENDVFQLKERLERLTPERKPRWGSMSAGQMLCHLTDAVTCALSAPDPATEVVQGPPMVIRHAVRLWMPWPRGLPTLPEMTRTDPAVFKKDMDRLFRKMECLMKTRRDDWPVHPFFGPLDGLAWARLTWRHIHHHLRQFGL